MWAPLNEIREVFVIFDRFAVGLESLEKTSGRIDLAKGLSVLLSELSPDETAKALYMVQGQLMPSFAGEPMGMAGSLLLRAIGRALETLGAPLSEADLKKRLAAMGDPGLLAESLLPPGERPPVSLAAVYDRLLGISRLSGTGSQDDKILKLSRLLADISPLSARFVCRFVMGRLRLGVGDATILDALVQTVLPPSGEEAALKAERKRVREALEGAYNLCSDLGRVGAVLREEGLEGIRKIAPMVGYPVRMALCERLGSGEEIVEKIGRAAVESKYDGFRCQIHCAPTGTRLFSRNLEETTAMFPEIARAASELFAGRSAIFEGEALGYDAENDSYHPFQVTITRKRKHNILEKSSEIPLKCLVFDILYLDGVSLMDRPFLERRKILEELFPVGVRGIADRELPPEGVFGASRLIVTGDPHEVDLFFDEVVEEGFEGVIAKRLDGVYSAGSRNFNWIKLKRSYKSALSDTVDLALIGYYRGKGLRTKLGIGAVLGAVYDPERGEFQSVARIGSGLTEEGWRDLRGLLEDLRTDGPPPGVVSGLVPDFWVRPELVVPVLADELTRSPTHRAGRREGEEEGFALRFPRMVSGPRADKRAEDATTAEELRRLYEIQRQRLSGKGEGGG